MATFGMFRKTFLISKTEYLNSLMVNSHGPNGTTIAAIFHGALPSPPSPPRWGVTFFFVNTLLFIIIKKKKNFRLLEHFFLPFFEWGHRIGSLGTL